MSIALILAALTGLGVYGLSRPWEVQTDSAADDAPEVDGLEVDPLNGWRYRRGFGWVKVTPTTAGALDDAA